MAVVRRIGKGANNREPLQCIPIRAHFRVPRRMRICLINRRPVFSSANHGRKKLSVSWKILTKVSRCRFKPPRSLPLVRFCRVCRSAALRRASGILAYSGFPNFAALPAEGKAATVVQVLALWAHALVDDCFAGLARGAAACGRGSGTPHPNATSETGATGRYTGNGRGSGSGNRTLRG